MPKYRYKKRLERYLAAHGEPDALTRYLILSGYSDEAVDSGLAWFVEAWEETVRGIEKFGFRGEEEWDCDLGSRDRLYVVLEYATPEQARQFSLRIAAADDRFKAITEEASWPTWAMETIPAGYWWRWRQLSS